MADPSVYERLYHWLYATEGPVRFMYLDKLGLVTVGIGFMIEPIENFRSEYSSAFRKQNGSPANWDEVKIEFARVKKMQDKKGAWKNFQPGAQLFLSNEFLKPKLISILKQKEAALKMGWQATYFSAFDTFPPDAQMGILSTAYGGMGNSSAGEVAFNKACQAQRWADAADSGRWAGWMQEKISGHKLMFKNAQVAKDTGDTNPQPSFPGTMTATGYEIDDTIKPFGQNIWTAGGP